MESVLKSNTLGVRQQSNKMVLFQGLYLLCFLYHLCERCCYHVFYTIYVIAVVIFYDD